MAEQHINYQRIDEAIRFIEANFKRQPELEEIAEHVHLSPFHFQRMFTEWAGISPKRFLQYLTVDFLKSKLAESKNLVEAAESAGLSSQSRVYDLFTTLEAVTPQEYRLHGEGIVIEYGFHETPFGCCLIGITQRGICWLSFISSEADRERALDELAAFWNRSQLLENTSLTAGFVTKIFYPESKGKLSILVKGTNFQVKVWEALLKIPAGSITTYEEVARNVKNDRAVQAVGSAIGSNHIAYLIPCHRVIRKDAVLGEYRWTSTRKKGMIGWEMGRGEVGF